MWMRRRIVSRDRQIGRANIHSWRRRETEMEIHVRRRYHHEIVNQSELGFPEPKIHK
jgi:hypothetical protein